MDTSMGLTNSDRKELELLIKVAIHDPKAPIDLARKMMPRQGAIEEFAYGLISGMVLGNFMSIFESRNGRAPDRDETADILSVLMVKMPLLRRSIMKLLELR